MRGQWRFSQKPMSYFFWQTSQIIHNNLFNQFTLTGRDLHIFRHFARPLNNSSHQLVIRILTERKTILEMKFQYRFSEICTFYVVLQNLLALLLPVTIYKIILKQICTTLKKPYEKRVRQKSLQDSPTIWTFTWRIGYREQSNLELNHSFFSKDHQALTEARIVPNF